MKLFGKAEIKEDFQQEIPEKEIIKDEIMEEEEIHGPPNQNMDEMDDLFHSYE